MDRFGNAFQINRTACEHQQTLITKMTACTLSAWWSGTRTSEVQATVVFKACLLLWPLSTGMLLAFLIPLPRLFSFYSMTACRSNLSNLPACELVLWLIVVFWGDMWTPNIWPCHLSWEFTTGTQSSRGTGNINDPRKNIINQSHCLSSKR